MNIAHQSIGLSATDAAHSHQEQSINSVMYYI